MKGMEHIWAIIAFIGLALVFIGLVGSLLFG